VRTISAWGLALGFFACACGARDGGVPIVPVDRGTGTTPVPAATSAEVARAEPSVDPGAALPESGGVVRVLVAGDAIPHRPMLGDASRLASALSPLGPLFGAADAVVVNHEGTVAGASSPPPGVHTLVAPADWTAALLGAGARVQTFANNHACDRGKPGLRASLEAALAAGVVPAGLDGEDPWKPRVLAERGGRRACIVAWTTFVNDTGRGCGASPYLAIAPSTPTGDRLVAGAITRARTVCDAVVAVFHGGTEYAGPTPETKRTARAAARAGAVAVVAHHPHVPAPVELVEGEGGRKVPFFASLGNLVSNQGESWTPAMPARNHDRRLVYVNGWTRVGMVADLAIELGERARVHWGYHLVWTENDHVLDRAQAAPRIAVRLLHAGDAPAVAKLRRDGTGPVAIFDDDCRIEGGARPSCE
jgi:poly-gamma-glutamate synthesis protein (capsule biosynthesis protein)